MSLPRPEAEAIDSEGRDTHTARLTDPQINVAHGYLLSQDRVVLTLITITTTFLLFSFLITFSSSQMVSLFLGGLETLS